MAIRFGPDIPDSAMYFAVASFFVGAFVLILGVASAVVGVVYFAAKGVTASL